VAHGPATTVLRPPCNDPLRRPRVKQRYPIRTPLRYRTAHRSVPDACCPMPFTDALYCPLLPSLEPCLEPALSRAETHLMCDGLAPLDVRRTLVP
jgi:hypothetical protein